VCVRLSVVCVFALDSSYTLLSEAECCSLVFWIYFLLLLLLLNKSLRLGVTRTFYTISYQHTTITFLFSVTVISFIFTRTQAIKTIYAVRLRMYIAMWLLFCINIDKLLGETFICFLSDETLWREFNKACLC
jgi:hypothetical protein